MVKLPANMHRTSLLNKMLRYITAMLLLITAKAVVAQKPFVIGVTDSLQSAVLKEQRTINIYLPEEYSDSLAKRYPVIYLLDGSANEDFVHVAGLVQFFTMIEKMPKSIIVGIANKDRKHDLTFPTTNAQDKKDFPTTGGSANFISFIAKELQPFVARHYRIANNATLIGQSLGGLLATEILLKQPQLFNNYIIVSPSLWWDDESLIKQADLFKNIDGKPVNVYIAVGGKEEKQMQEDAAVLSMMLKTSKAANKHIAFVTMPEEDHLTILHNALYNAFLWLHGMAIPPAK